MKFRNNGENEPYYRGYENERYSNNTQIVCIVSSVFCSEEIDDKLHIDLSEHSSDIGGEHYPECVFNDFFNQVFIVDDFRILEVWNIIILIHKEHPECYPDNHPSDPSPGISYKVSKIQEIEPHGKEHDENHPKELGSFLELGILTHSEDGSAQAVDIYPKEKQTENFYNPHRLS